jgi:hypothetical protein
MWGSCTATEVPGTRVRRTETSGCPDECTAGSVAGMGPPYFVPSTTTSATKSGSEPYGKGL